MKQRKSYNWYAAKQRFSIRKYHFGAASVLLGVSLALAGGAKALANTVEPDTLPQLILEAQPKDEGEGLFETGAEFLEGSVPVEVSTEGDTLTPVETVTEETQEVVERTATINYIVNYVLEDGTLVNAVVKSATVTTTDATAKTTVEVVAELPEGYELATGQAATVSQEVTEAGENLVTVKLVKKAVATPASTPATTSTTATPATTTATPVATTPVTVEEGKVVLEQNISEAVVLSDEANRLYTAAPEGNESLKTAADATKLATTEATTVLKDSVATLEQVNAQIDAVRTNVEALALELRKRDEDGVLTAMLTTTTTSTLGIGEGSGTLINTSTTATPDMADPNGAAVTAPVEGTYVGTTEVGYTTVDFTPLSYYDAIMGWQKYRDLNGQSTGGAYFRTSVLTGAPSSPLLIELVDKTGSVLESKFITQGETASFTTFQATSGVNLPLEVSYRPDAGSTSIYGTTFFTFDENTMEVSRFIPQPVTATTYYKTLPNPDSINLATYEIGTVPGATTTPSGQREFLGYAYDSTTTETTTLGLSATVPYVDYARANMLGVGHKTVVSPVDTNGTIVRDFYVAGTSVEGTLDYFSADTTGFIHILTSSQLAPGESNTAMVMNSDLLDKGYKVYIVDASQPGQTNNDIIPPNGTLVTDPAQLDFSSLSTTSHWFHIVINENPALGELGFTRVRLGSPKNPSRIQLQYSTRLDGTKDINNDGQPDTFLGTNIGFAMNNTPVYSLTETTHWYTPIPQIAQIIYQTEDGTQLDNIDSVTGNPGDTINYSTTNRINAYKLAGYELVSDGGPQSGQDATFDFTNDDATDPSQKFYVVLKERIVDIPKDVVPGQPVDPTDPNSPVWPDSVGNLSLTEEVTRTITYVDEAGNEVATTFTDKVTFTRTAQVNLVTGDITYGAWTADKADNVLDGNVLPEVPGYTATTATKDGADVTPASTTVYAQVAADSADIVEKVVYVQDTQTAKITISTVDANGGNKTEFAAVTETGKATEPIATKTTEDVLLELKALGYDVEVKVTDTFLDSAKTFDNVKDAADQPSQSYEIVVKPRIVDIPKDVVPGQPVDPTDPNSPVWPAGVDNLTLTEEVTRTITYVNEAGEEVATTFTDKVTFTRTAQVNLVTGDITYGAWTADNADSVLDGNVLPEVPGYTATTATKDGADVTPASTTVYAQVAADSADIVEKVVYVQDTQTAKITISTVDANGGNKTEYATVNETGKHTEPVATTTVEEKLLELKRKGYDVETKITDTFLDSAKTFDNVKDTADQPSQSYEIVVKERVVDIPKDVVPGQPVDPNDPNSPVWPAGVDNLTLTEEVTRTITYVDEAGNEVAATFTEKVTFSRTAQVNLVTGEITYSDWTADNGDNVLAGNPLPTVADHQVSTATKDGVAVLPASTNSEVPVVADSADIVEKVVYVKDKGSVTIQYKDTDGNVIKAPVIDEDNVAVGTAYDTTNEGDKPTVIPNADGTKYVLVPSLTEGAETGTVVKDGTTVTYVYQKVANWIPVIPGLPENERPVFPYPFDPENPDQPLTPTPDTVIPYVPGYVPVGPDGKTPLTPVDPNDPTKGYEPPTPSTPGDNTYIPYVKVEKGSVLVAFVDEAGSPIKSVVTDTDNAEVGTSYDTTDQKEDVIKANGFTYYFKEVKAGSAETGKVVEGVTTVTYVYTKVANWIPVIPGIPENERPVFPYPFDPTNPDKPIDPTTPGTVIPYVPGYVPVGPDGTTPLTPVDPEDPSKGYVPPTPSTPGDNTYIPYVKAGSVVVKYQDTDGKELIAPVVDENNVKVGTAYDTTDQKKSEIIDAEGNRYVLVPSKTVGSETGEVTDGTTEVIYVYQKVANWIPQIPGVPANEYPVVPYPFDPNNPDVPVTPTPDTVIPYVPGYVPVGPDGVTPLTPVDPEDPSKGYVPPTVDNPGENTPIPYVKAGSVVVKYQDTDGKELIAPVVDENNVKVGTAYDTTDQKKTEIIDAEGNRYVLVPYKTVGSETGEVTDGTTEVIYVYQKVANWIPQIPGVPTDQLPKTSYPFDPEKPTAPITGIPTNPITDKPVVPFVDGYTPVDPATNTPLTPVDETDLTKGYIPPTVTNPGKDTLIPYVQDKGSVTIQYKDTDGNVIKDPVTDEDNVVVGMPYDTTDEGDKPTEIVTKDGSRYVLVPSKTEGAEKGKVAKNGTTVTYVYQKVANWIPELPGVPDNERPRIPYPFDPNNPDTPLPPSPDTVVPYVPGYIPVGPDGVTPLTPVDPADPSKGYVPPTPKIPNEDMRIPYIPVKKGSVTIQYRDTDGNVIKDSVTDEDNVVVGTPYDTTDEGDKPTEIVTKDGSRYVLVPSKTIGTEKGQVSEGSSTVTYVYQKVANWIPELPGVPDNERPRIPYPFDPNNPDTPLPPSPDTVVPYVPGYIPVGPDGVTPLTPVDPADPSKGYVPPTPKTPNEDMRIPYVPTVPAEPAQPVPPVVPVEPEQPVPPVVPAEPEQPVPPVVPAEPEQPVPPVVPVEPAQPVVPESPKGSELATPHTPTTTKAGAAQLPNTGEANTVALPALGLSMLVATLALAGKRRSMEE
ncbi:mucin-binding protein [Streptococcus iners]|uniref:MucBP domain-containing protein n=1 Tax=Streptococcus iners TaxID=3028084 RepID=A0AA96VKI9_9STRE|nr:MucBP domain-containing protein [Streptococcus sp. 29887]MCK4025061.1 YSIRK-type signal peptide-containing protein [Streptococcus suis]WNY50863.1 MucBP domain-containing protein [Streptococcus sp. 29887]